MIQISERIKYSIMGYKMLASMCDHIISINESEPQNNSEIQFLCVQTLPDTNIHCSMWWMREREKYTAQFYEVKIITFIRCFRSIIQKNNNIFLYIFIIMVNLVNLNMILYWFIQYWLQTKPFIFKSGFWGFSICAHSLLRWVNCL